MGEDKKKPDKKPKSEKLSQREWEKIMGTDRDTYKRHNGAIRRK